jgi:hypothetical protein
MSAVADTVAQAPVTIEVAVTTVVLAVRPRLVHEMHHQTGLASLSMVVYALVLVSEIVVQAVVIVAHRSHIVGVGANRSTETAIT